MMIDSDIDATTPIFARNFQMCGRNTADEAMAKVKRLVVTRIVCRQDGSWRRPCIGDEANPISKIKLSRLLRNIGSRIKVTEEKLHTFAAGFRIDAADAVRQKAINHDAVEARDTAHRLSETLAEVLGRIRVLHARQHGLHESESIFGVAFAHGLQFQHHERPASVDESVDSSAIAAAGDGEGVHRPDRRPFGVEKGSELGNAVGREPIREVRC